MNIKFKINAKITSMQVVDLFKSSGINRPIDDEKRIQSMIDQANVN